jgi:hypothetical protein
VHIFFLPVMIDKKSVGKELFVVTFLTNMMMMDQ